MATQLLIATIGYAAVTVVIWSLGLFVFLQNRKRTLNVLFGIMSFFSGFFAFYFSIVINLPPSPLAYTLWLTNVTVIFSASIYAHFIFCSLDKEARYRWYIILSYGFSFLLVMATLFFPHEFLPFVSAKLFTKSYLNAGPLYYLMVTMYSLIPLFPTYVLFREYFRKTTNRTVAEYFIVAALIGFGTGGLDFYLVFDIPVSPLWGMLYGLWTVPIAYGIVSKNLLDIRLVIKRAFFYAVGIALTAGVLTALILFNNILVARVPGLQFWTIPVVTAIVAFVFGRTFWLQSQEADKLKYEFITVATHKLRTPLTRIRWSVAALLDEARDPELLKGLKNIDDSSNRLLEITDVLLNASQVEQIGYRYRRESIDLSALVRALPERFSSLIAEKRLAVSIAIPEALKAVTGDPERLNSAIEVLFENALIYTPAGGTIAVSLAERKREVLFSVKDSGIGVRSEDQQRIFTRFFRTDQAKLTDTEGIGLGLSMAKNIIERHGGKMGVESEGVGKGSTFWFTLPRS